MEPIVLRLLVVAGILAAAALVGRWWNARDGRLARADGGFDTDQLRRVGLDRDDAEAVALLLGSPTCAPCVTVRRILTEVAAERPAFHWAYADAADHLDLVEQHRVMRVPTLFVLDPSGRVLVRTSGVPVKDDLLAALAGGGALAPSAA